jgi:hypothetical protein
MSTANQNCPVLGGRRSGRGISVFLGVTCALSSERTFEDGQGWIPTGLTTRLGPRNQIRSSPDRSFENPRMRA